MKKRERESETGKVVCNFFRNRQKRHQHETRTRTTARITTLTRSNINQQHPEYKNRAALGNYLKS